MPRVENPNVDRDNRLHEGVRLHHPQFNLGRRIEHDYVHLLRKLYRDQKAAVLTDEESDMFEVKKGTKHGDPLSSLLSNTVLQRALEKYIFRCQKKKRNGNMPERQRSRAPFCILRRSAPKNVVRVPAKYRKSETWNPSRKDENSQQPKLEQQKRN